MKQQLTVQKKIEPRFLKKRMREIPHMNSKILFAGLLVTMLFLIGCAQQPPPGPEPTPSSISVSGQEFKSTVIIDTVFLDKPGFVVIHSVTPDEKPGAVAGNSLLITGSAQNTEILVQEGATGSLIAMLHYDNGDGQYTSLDEDVPVKVNNSIVMQKFGRFLTEQTKGTLEATITNPDGNAVENAVVEVFVENEKIASTRTNAEGKALLEELPLDKEWYVTAADAQNAFQAVSGEIGEPRATNSLMLQLLTRTEARVTLRTNKSVYPVNELEQGLGEFTVVNNNSMPIFLNPCDIFFVRIFKKITGSFEEINTQRGGSECLLTNKIEISPHNTRKEAFGINIALYEGRTLELPGSYKIAVEYSYNSDETSAQPPFTRIESNEFEIIDSNLTPQTIDLNIESDDNGFYKDGERTTIFSVPAGSTVNLTVKQRTINSSFGGLDIKSSAFTTFNVPSGQQRTVSFTVTSNVKIESFWPSSSVKKSEITFSPQ